MGNLIYITGGSRSGKSSCAVNIAKETEKQVVFIATCAVFDGEMKERVRKHKKSRPENWTTCEEQKNLSSALTRINPKVGTVIIDCLTIYVSNLMGAEQSDDNIISNIRLLCKEIKRAACTVIVVSNEVGCGIVPENALARRFRDIAGIVNQIVAGNADEAYIIISGQKVRIK